MGACWRPEGLSAALEARTAKNGAPGAHHGRENAVLGSFRDPQGGPKIIKNAKNRFPKIDSFCDCLPASTLKRFRRVLGGSGEGLGRVLEILFSRFFVSVAKIAMQQKYCSRLDGSMNFKGSRR